MKKKQAANREPAFFVSFGNGPPPGEDIGFGPEGREPWRRRFLNAIPRRWCYCALPGALSGALVALLPVLPLFGVFLVL